MFSTEIDFVKVNVKPQDHQYLIDLINEADAECEAIHWTHTPFFSAAVDIESIDPIVIALVIDDGFYVAEVLEPVIRGLLDE